jgi:exonuclease III
MCLPQVIKSFQNYRGVATTFYPTLVFPVQGRLAQLNKIMGEYKLAVLGVSEVRWNGNRRTETTNDNIFVYSGMPNIDDDHIRGVGILINKEVRVALFEWNPVSERIITARIQTKLRKISIIQCYAPTENAATC